MFLGDALPSATMQTQFDPRAPHLADYHAELKNILRWPPSEPDNSSARRGGNIFSKPCDDEQDSDKVMLFETSK